MLLKGIRVLDLSNLLPGPMCSLFLADLGANVIKVESLNGDPMRYIETSNKQSPYFSALNRNKKSITLNLKSGEGKKIFMKLARDTDIIIEGFRPGKVDSLGIGYKDIKRINHKIIYCSISGYGQKGGFRDRAGHDLNYLSLSGLLDIMSSKPFVPGVQVADAASALIAAFSIVAALFYSQNSGKSSYIDVPILNSSLALINMHIAHHSISNNTKTVLSGSMPCYNVYETKDSRYVSFAAIEKKFWRSFCNSMNRADLLPKQFDDENKTIKEVKSIFKSKTLDEWVKLNKKHDFCCEPVNKIGEAVNNPYFKNINLIITLEGIKQVAMPVTFSSIKKFSYSRAPRLGESTKEILKSLGYSNFTINKLIRERVVS